ncbi:MAG: hypothetical protein IKJ93_07035 [Clostridia bacterium]|nr:hypothetical protein [Clostridia bacterium]
MKILKINKKRLVWLKPIAFLLGLVLLISMISPLFTVSDKRFYRNVRGLYEEKPKSLDAVYVGSSNVFASWQAPAAFEEYGIACYGMSIGSLPALSIKYLVEECRKTQPDALYIINLNNFKPSGMEVTESDIHSVTNFLPMSGTKIKLINALSEKLGYTGLDKAEFFLPIIRFHSGWNEFTPNTYDYELDGLKGAASYSLFLKKRTDILKDFQYTSQRSPILESQEEALRDLISYFQNENAKVLFVFAPQAITNEIHIEQINTMKDFVNEQGLPVVDFMEDIDSLNLDIGYDFYDKFHFNVHGSLKFTHALGAYLKENYGFTDKRGNPDYASWDEAAKTYTDILKPYTLDFERDNSLRDKNVDKPTLSGCEANGQSIKLNWTKTSKATGYAVYRQYTDPKTKKLLPWEFVAETDGDTLTYTDNELQRNVKYKYTVVPFYTKDGQKVYGDFDFEGISATTTLPAPPLVSLEEGDNGVTITWEDIDDESGYIIFRRMGTQNWVRLGSVKANTTSYTDKKYQKDLPYTYVVKSYEKVDGKEKIGGHVIGGILLYKDITSPKPVAQLTNSGPKISWDIVDGATHYSVYVKNASGQWSAVASHITDNTCIDENYTEGATPIYKVVAEIKQHSKYHEFPSEPVVLTKGDN